MVVADAVRTSPISFAYTGRQGQAPTAQNVSCICLPELSVPSGQDQSAIGLVAPGASISQR